MKLKETLINSYVRRPVFFMTGCVSVLRRSCGCAFRPFPCHSQKASGQSTNSFNQPILTKQMFLPVLLSLSVFFSSTVAISASAYASAVTVSDCVSDTCAGTSSVALRTAVVRQMAEAAPNNTDIPDVEKKKPETSERSGTAKSRNDSSFFDDLLEKIAVMFLVYMFIHAIHEILNEFFRDGDVKIKVTPKEKQDIPDGKGTNRKNVKRIPAQDV